MCYRFQSVRFYVLVVSITQRHTLFCAYILIFSISYILNSIFYFVYNLQMYNTMYEYIRQREKSLLFTKKTAILCNGKSVIVRNKYLYFYI